MKVTPFQHCSLSLSLSLSLFIWRLTNILSSAHQVPDLLAWRQLDCQAKVCNLDVKRALPMKKNIFRLETEEEKEEEEEEEVIR